MTRLVVVTAGLSQPSVTRLLADRLTDAVGDRLRVKDQEPEVTVLELRELGTDIMSAMLTAGMSSARLTQAGAAIAAADAVLAVTPVFTASYSGLFKSFFDALDPGVLRGTPVLIGATAGTERHSLVLDHALRPMFTYLQAVVVPTGVFAATSDFGGKGDGVVDGLSQRIARAADELVALLSRHDTPSSGRDASGPSTPDSARRHTDALARAEADEAAGSFTPFDQLLGHSA
ncbi:MAG: CE1759 family FMN reductase [Ornithinimicrobium sp.]|uniref:CE1759 family FMN reductase n=1 Tax=Ornithinimicrobium sp. TaxID=1977084 RepID=UPI003D9B7A08